MGNAKDSTVITVEDFLTEPRKTREAGLAANFIDWSGPDGIIYKRICITEVPGLQESLEELVGPVDMLGQAFRLNYADELPNCSIHTDVGWGTHALVLYLMEDPAHTGTAFWKHRSSGKTEMLPGDTETFVAIKNDTEDLYKWDPIGFVEAKFNRAAIYSSHLFHSRWPFEGLGDCPENGRLTAVAFFTPKGE